MSASESDDPPTGKRITGYCEPWSLRAGDHITLHASSHDPGPAQLDLVRIICGDPTKAGPGFREEVVEAAIPTSVDLDEQRLSPGSWGDIDLRGLRAERSLTVRVALRATRPADDHDVLSVGPIAVRLRAGKLHVTANDAATVLRDRPLDARRWYHLTIEARAAASDIVATLSTEPSASPARDLFEPGHEEATLLLGGPMGPVDLDRLVLAAAPAAGHGSFDGRLGALSLTIDDTELRWDFSERMDSPDIVEVSGAERHGRLYQLPARGVTGPTWDGSIQRWSEDPGQYDAVHFHHDDLYDAGWDPTVSLALPADLPSGTYAFRTTQASESGDDQVDRVPFFVRPAIDAPTADVALLMSSATYMAYANHHMLFDGADFIAERSRLRPEHEYVRQNHRSLGHSMYEKHPDRSGVMFSSRRRPVLNLRPGADGWNFTPDTDINAWLHHTGVGHDVIADEDVHTDGIAALEPYRVLVTCSHPEYWSTAMLDALAAWQRGGGRLMYLGGNGFYWRVAFSEHWPGAMELRRAEDGVRNWQTEDGENYHAWGGEYGGMWRRNGRPPNELVGIGFAAQGFARATYFDVDDASLDSRAAWIWDGVEFDEGRIGTSGLGGGAAGQEVDRYDTRLGSPAHAVVLASATDFGPDMVRTKEEFEGSVEYPTPDPYVRADIVFYETVGGGAVFSVGSISWFGSLARNGYDNDTARMSTNVLRRFADPAPFELPEPGEATR